jgi:flagellar hook-associated protein 1 FlgK
MVTPVTSAAIDVTASVTQGTLGGIREARDTDIPRTMATLDQFASDLAGAVNAAHSAGFALDGTTGRALFVTTSTVTGSARALTLNSALDGRPELLGAAARATDVPGGNDVALRLAGLGSRALGAGSAPPGDRAAALVADVGTRRAAAEAEVQLRTDTVGQATELNESASGVSLDEEMVNLTRFQRAFEASTRVLRTADELLETLMNSF